MYLRCIRAAIFACLAASPAAGQTANLGPEAQALLNRARTATPVRYQYAIDQGARILPTADGRSFYLSWLPPGAASVNPTLVVALHGSSGWAFDEFFLWRDQAAAFGYGLVALQWWFGTNDANDAYYTPTDVHRELRAALKLMGNRQGNAILHGFSRGSANLYAVAALDRSSGDRLYAMFLANSGGASVDFPPNVAIAGGQYGFNVFSGTYWVTFCGGLDPNPERDGCPAMRRTADWVGLYGGIVELFIQDDRLGHGGLQQSPVHMRSALQTFRANLALRKDAVLPSTVWQVNRDPAFEVAGASIPNVGMVNGEVWLTVGGPGGARLYRSRDGSNASSGESLAGVAAAMNGSGFSPGEIVPRETPGGGSTLFVLGLAAPNVNRSAVFRLVSGAGGSYTRNPSEAAFAGGPEDAQFLGVPDVTRGVDGRLRLMYVSRGSRQSNSRTAISADDGATFTAEFHNAFGDLAVPNPQATNINVDPAVLKLANGGYLAVTMRATRLYVFTSIDGRSFIPSVQPAIEAAQLFPGATGLFDPTLVQLPDGRVLMYVTAPTNNASRVVRAELIPQAGSSSPEAAVTAGGVRNAASLTEEVAPGSIVAIFGSDLAVATLQAQSYPLPAQMGGASVTIGGRAAPLFYASPTQINAQVPVDLLPGNTTVQIGAGSATVALRAAAPGIFKLQGDLAALGSVVPGGPVTLYLTGQGEVAPPVATGSAAPSSPLSRATLAVQATIGGKASTVTFAGLAPGYAGLMQLNLTVPDLAPGDHAVVVTIGGAVSSPATIRVGAQ